MNRRKLLFGLLGLGCLAAGTVVQGVGSRATALVSEAGGDYVLVAALSGVALLAALPVVVSGRESELQQVETPDPEVPVRVPPAGREFDETVRGWDYRTPVLGDSTRQRVKTRLRKAAVEAVMRERNCGRSRARRLVRRGEWTDDAEAASFLGSPSRSTLATAVSALPRRRTPAEFRARRTAEAIYAVSGGTGR
ncbi:hypothetical protein C5B90_17565 [Haloferax sp. Atlit-12N]|uniref:DUF7269 family protein n=1 Tax=Haloferax sp. Atlit-12N TaxID=2077203 RepID=UPI000E27CF4E|nr:hypothetical protein [Haloferax sp. Atlit-12N]RDZ62164.1 hypothetical protein C5B90_17565 [Haloferax sp. Atlit-12N]